MFKNIGGSLKALAKIVFWVGLIASIICGICAWSDWWLFDGFLNFLVFGIAPAVFFYVTSMLIYGFGELVENSQILAQNSTNNTSQH